MRACAYATDDDGAVVRERGYKGRTRREGTMVVSVGCVVITNERGGACERTRAHSSARAHTAMRSPAVRKKTTDPTKRAIERSNTPFASRIAGFGELNSRSRKEAMDMTTDGVCRADGKRIFHSCIDGDDSADGDGG